MVPGGVRHGKIYMAEARRGMGSLRIRYKRSPEGVISKECGIVEKNILQGYADAKARVKYLRSTTEKLRKKIGKLKYTEYGLAGDTVSRGKRGKKPLGTVRISGFPVPEYQKTVQQLKIRRRLLEAEEAKLAAMVCDAEKFIEPVRDLEVRNILSLYYIDGMTWVQVARTMNVLYSVESYSPGGCRKKHDRFIGKI